MWKILEIKANDGLITQAKYFVSHQGVETEGYWTFREPKMTVPFADVTEEMIVSWVREETTENKVNMIEKRLADQAAALQKEQETPLPWMPQVFTPEL